MSDNKLKYPLLLVHGMGFRDRKRLNYWGRIPSRLQKMGAEIFYGNQDSNASIETNALFLKNRIEEILAQTGSEKVNIIAHSKGGLDCRYAITALGMEDNVASLTTISTPHNGSKTVDLLLKLPDCLVRLAGGITDVFYKILGDKKPSSYEVFHSFTTKNAMEFNKNVPDSAKVYYQSYAFVMKNPTSDIFMWFPNFVVNIIEGQNDGLLTPEATRWTNFKGIYKGNGNRGISHCDQVDMRRHRLTKKQGSDLSDICTLYETIVSDLTNMGF